MNKTKVYTKNLSCISNSVQYTIEGGNIVLSFNHQGIAEVDSSHVEHLLPYGISEYTESSEVFDIANATDEELLTFLKGSTIEFLSELATSSEYPETEWAHKGATSLAIYLFDKMKSGNETEGDMTSDETEIKKSGRGRKSNKE